MGFFDSPQGAAIFKHALLRSYTRVFVQKTGSRRDAASVGVVDGYAGRGWYEDGSEGSPAVLVDTLADLLNAESRTQLWFVEKNNGNFEALRQATGGRGRVANGTLHECLPQILVEADAIPLFVFVDPFGVGLPFDQMVELLHRPRGRGTTRSHVTEVLVTFVYASVYRNAGKLTIHSSNNVQVRNAAATVDRLNDNLGGDWWHAHQRASRPDIVDAIRDGYLERLLTAAPPGWKVFRFPVSDFPRHRPQYDLVLFTQHDDGIWHFNNAIARARGPFVDHVIDKQGSVQLSLLETPVAITDAIRTNLHRLLSDGRPHALNACTAKVFEGVVGHAGQSEATSVLRRMEQAGEIAPLRGSKPDRWVLKAIQAVDGPPHSVAS